MTDAKLEAAIEAGARAFHNAARDKGALRWETASERYRQELRDLVRPAVVAALAAGAAVQGAGMASPLGQGGKAGGYAASVAASTTTQAGAGGGTASNRPVGAGAGPLPRDEALRQRAQDALDAARYRWLRAGNATRPDEQGIVGGIDLDELCDYGMRGGSGAGSR